MNNYGLSLVHNGLADMADSSEYCCSQRWIMVGNG